VGRQLDLNQEDVDDPVYGDFKRGLHAYIQNYMDCINVDKLECFIRANATAIEVVNLDIR
jgi:hypothetical protein